MIGVSLEGSFPANRFEEYGAWRPAGLMVGVIGAPYC